MRMQQQQQQAQYDNNKVDAHGGKSGFWLSVNGLNAVVISPRNAWLMKNCLEKYGSTHGNWYVIVLYNIVCLVQFFPSHSSSSSSCLSPSSFCSTRLMSLDKMYQALFYVEFIKTSTVSVCAIQQVVVACLFLYQPIIVAIFARATSMKIAV